MQKLYLAVCLSIFTISASYAEEQLNGDQIKEVLSGNTAYGEHAKRGFEIIRYFAANGDLTQYRPYFTKRPRADGKWEVKGDQLCMELERHGQTCGRFVKSGDDYLWYKEHNKHIWTFKKIVSGNPEKL